MVSKKVQREKGILHPHPILPRFSVSGEHLGAVFASLSVCKKGASPRQMGNVRGGPLERPLRGNEAPNPVVSWRPSWSLNSDPSPAEMRILSIGCQDTLHLAEGQHQSFPCQNCVRGSTLKQGLNKTQSLFTCPKCSGLSKNKRHTHQKEKIKPPICR